MIESMDRKGNDLSKCGVPGLTPANDVIANGPNHGCSPKHVTKYMFLRLFVLLTLLRKTMDVTANEMIPLQLSHFSLRLIKGWRNCRNLVELHRTAGLRRGHFGDCWSFVVVGRV